MGIGTSSAQEKLHVVGNICYTGVAASWSDLRYKKNIAPLNNVLERLGSVRGVNYDWKVAAFPEKEFSQERQIGVLAQELEAAFPELVATDAQGFKTVAYPKLTAVLLQAIKEQQAQIAAQGQDIEQLKAMLGEQAAKDE